jgi:isoleucyl-tRNA synthetase
VPALTAALKALEGDAARAAAATIEAGEPLTLTVDGAELALLAEEVLVESSAPEGYAVAEGDGMLVALNTTLTPELRLEGAARDLVRSVQDARKSAGLDIADRISLFITTDTEAALLNETLEAWGEYLRGETLTTVLTVGPTPEGVYTETVEFGDGEAVIGVVKA